MDQGYLFVGSAAGPGRRLRPDGRRRWLVGTVAECDPLGGRRPSREDHAHVRPPGGEVNPEPADGVP